MKTTIDAAGRVVIPMEIRRRAGLGAGAEVEVRWRNGLIEFEPASRIARLVGDGPLLVAIIENGAEPLTVQQVEEIRETLWRDRAGGL